jgi:hypothetical protein
VPARKANTGPTPKCRNPFKEEIHNTVPAPKWRIAFKNQRRTKTQLQLQREFHSRIRGELKQLIGFHLQNGELRPEIR